ncbi:MAG TPA: hypothetical protein VGJ44_19375 [Kribbellaceae bacterium]|jgi:predicted RNase H-like nuclease (RuvC/YqgF family)
MAPEVTQLIVAGMTLLGVMCAGGVGALLLLPSNRRVLIVTAAEKNVASSMQLVDQLQEEVKAARSETSELRRELAEERRQTAQELRRSMERIHALELQNIELERNNREMQRRLAE